jgi:hypothetical protein
MATDLCFFCKLPGSLILAGSKRIDNIIRCGKERGDELHYTLVQLRREDPELSIKSHKNCVSTYTSSTHINRSLKRKGSSQRSHSEPSPRKRRSTSVSFSFRTQCFICTDECIPLDSKNPSRWRPVIHCRSADRPGLPTFKDTLLSICKERNDALGKEVQTRLLGAVADLHAADACYQADCYKTFTSQRNIKASQACDTAATSDTSFKQLTTDMSNDPSHIWTSLELHNTYKSYGGKVSRRSLISQLNLHFAPDLLIMSIEGCASLLVFKDHAPRYLNIVEADDDDHYKHIRSLTKTIKAEVKTFKKQTDYDLNQFTLEKAKSSTSATLRVNFSTNLWW